MGRVFGEIAAFVLVMLLIYFVYKVINKWAKDHDVVEDSDDILDLAEDKIKEGMHR